MQKVDPHEININALENNLVFVVGSIQNQNQLTDELLGVSLPINVVKFKRVVEMKEKAFHTIPSGKPQK